MNMTHQHLEWIDHRIVAITALHSDPHYPKMPPFRPDRVYPEFNGRVLPGAECNPVFSLCRQLFFDLGLDAENFSTPSWNPLGGLVQPGQKVLIKPNLVRHLHLTGGMYETVVTHGSLIRCLLDYVALALRGQGAITVGDAPVQSADFSKIVERNGLRAICDDVEAIWGLPVKLVDFRLWTVKLDEMHRPVEGQTLGGDPFGYKAVNLGTQSLLAPLANQHKLFRVTSYDCHEMATHHNRQTNEYLIPKTVLDADVVINLPKLKTHRKVGMTAALKNLVGINGHKDWLPHHRCGAIEEGGDEYLMASRLKTIKSEIESRMGTSQIWSNPLSRLAVRATRKIAALSGKDSYEEGSWYGNDTLWRTVLDLNRLLIYADREGVMNDLPQRRCFTVVDGIIAGEGEGPMEPDPRACGVLVAGTSPVAVDTVLATMIGFDYRKIPIISRGFEIKDWPLAEFSPLDINIVSSGPPWQDLKAGHPCQAFCFTPPAGWSGHIECE